MSGNKKIPAFIFDTLAGVTPPPSSADKKSSNVIKPKKEIVINSFNLTRFRNACKEFIPNDYYTKLGNVVTLIKKYQNHLNIKKVEDIDEDEKDEDIFYEENKKSKAKKADKLLDAIKRYFKRLLKKIFKPFRNIKAFFKKLKRRFNRTIKSVKQKIKRGIKNLQRRIKNRIRKGIRSIKRYLKRKVKQIKRACKRIIKTIGKMVRRYGPTVKRYAIKAFRTVKSVGMKTIRGIRKILQPAFTFFCRVFNIKEPGSTRPGKLKSFASKLSSNFIKTVESGGKSVFKFGKKAIPFIAKMVKKLAIKMAPKLVKIFKAFVPFILKLIKKIIMIAAKAALSAAATAGTVATFGAGAAGAIISYGLLIYEIVDTVKLIAELAPTLSDLAGSLMAEKEYMSDLEDDSEEGPPAITKTEYTPEELAELKEAGEELEYQRASSIQNLHQLKMEFKGNPDISKFIDNEIKVVEGLSNVADLKYRSKYFNEVLEKEQKKISKIQDRIFFDDNGEQKFIIEGEKEISALMICTKFIEYAKRKLLQFGTPDYFNKLYESVNIKNFTYEVNDLDLPEFSKDGQMTVEEIKLINEKNKGIRGASLLAALNANNYDAFEHTRPARIEKDLEVEKQKEKYNFFVDILVALTGSSNNHEKLKV